MAERVTQKDKLLKHSGDSRIYTFGMGQLLGTSETITGTPTVAGSPSGLTIGTASVNASVISEEGETVAIGEGVQVRISGGTALTDYAVTVTAVTSDSNTVKAIWTLQVRDS